MGSGATKFDLHQAQQDRVHQERRQARLYLEHARADQEMVHMRITEPRRGRNGQLVGQPSFQYEGPEEYLPHAMKIRDLNQQAITYAYGTGNKTIRRF